MDYILVTDWEKVEKDDFYLSDDWQGRFGEDKKTMKQAKKLQKEGNLYFGYIVSAKSYALYYQMDADTVYIDEDSNIISHCESSVIGNNHEHREDMEL